MVSRNPHSRAEATAIVGANKGIPRPAPSWPHHEPQPRCMSSAARRGLPGLGGVSFCRVLDRYLKAAGLGAVPGVELPKIRLLPNEKVGPEIAVLLKVMSELENEIFPLPCKPVPLKESTAPSIPTWPPESTSIPTELLENSEWLILTLLPLATARPKPFLSECTLSMEPP